MPKYVKTYTIRFLKGRLMNVVRRRGRKFCYRPRLMIDDRFWHLRDATPAKDGVLTFRAEAVIPGGPAEWGAHSLSNIGS